VIREEGLEDLMANIPIEIEEIEEDAYKVDIPNVVVLGKRY
jgi:hypothetical protein